MATTYRVRTTAQYLVKGDEKVIVKQTADYSAAELNGFKAQAATVHVTNKKTKEFRVWFPGEVMRYKLPKAKKKKGVK